MAFDIYGPATHFSDDSCDSAFFEFVHEIDAELPLLTGIDFYGSNVFHAERVPDLRNELVIVRDSIRSEVKSQIAKRKKVHAKDPARFESILEPILRKESPIYAYTLEFICICDEAIAADSSVRCEGD